MLRICYVYCTSLKPENIGFSEQHPCRLATILENRAQVYALYGGSADKDLFRKHGVIPVTMNAYLLRRGYLLRFLTLIYYTCKIGLFYKIDIFMNVWDHYFMLPVWIGARLCGTRTIASIGGIPIQRQYTKSKNFKNYLRKNIGLLLECSSLQVVSRIHTVAYSLKSEFVKRGIAVDKIEVISRGIDTAFFQPCMRTVKYDQNYHIGTLCKLTKRKNVDTIIRAFGLIEIIYPKMHLYIAGEGEEKQNLIKLVSEMNLDEKVTFYGHVTGSQVFDFYSKIDLFVLSSKWEGITNVILEALAMGLPVIATDVGDNCLHLQEGRGRVFEVGDYETMARMIEEMYSSMPEAEYIRINRRDYVVRNHSFRVLTEKYMCLFQSARGLSRCT